MNINRQFKLRELIIFSFFDDSNNNSIVNFYRQLLDRCYDIKSITDNNKKSAPRSKNKPSHQVVVYYLQPNAFRYCEDMDIHTRQIDKENFIKSTWLNNNIYQSQKDELIYVMKDVNCINKNFFGVYDVFPKYRKILCEYADSLDMQKISLVYQLFCTNCSITITLTTEEEKALGVNPRDINPLDFISSTEIIMLTQKDSKKWIYSNTQSNESPIKLNQLDSDTSYHNSKTKKIGKSNNSKNLYLLFEAISNYSISDTNEMCKNIRAVSRDYTHITKSLTKKVLEKYKQRIKTLYEST